MKSKISLIIVLVLSNCVSSAQTENKIEDKSSPFGTNEAIYKEERFYPATCTENFEWKYIVKENGIGQCIYGSVVNIEGASYASQLATPTCPEESQWFTANSRLRVGKCVKETYFGLQPAENDQIAYGGGHNAYRGEQPMNCYYGYHIYRWRQSHSYGYGSTSHNYYTHHAMCVRDSTEYCQEYRNTSGICLRCVDGYFLSNDDTGSSDECISKSCYWIIYGVFIFIGVVFFGCAGCICCSFFTKRRR